MENTNDTILATSQSGENAQNQNTEQSKPAWQVKADELAKRIDGTLFVQLAYLSDQKHNCEPVLLSEKQEANIYPIAIDAPVGLTDPKMDWTKINWIENSTAGLATQLANLSADVEKIKDYQRDDAKAKQINQQKDNESSKLMSMVTSELGKLSVKVDKLLAAQSEPAKKLQKQDAENVDTSASTNQTTVKSAENVQQSQPTAVTEKEGE